jgi:3-hydroxybutyryl-CoA dehydrogenase
MSANPSIRTVGICGSGQMGVAAAVCFRRAGYRVLLWLRNPAKLAVVHETFSELEGWMRENMPPPPSDQGTLHTTADLALIDADADVILDCIAEVMADKAALFRNLGRARERRSLFLTTTSGLSITELGRQSGTENILAGAHFWNPPHLMPLVEVIRGQDTEDDVMDRAVALIQSIGKIAVRVNRDAPGFIGNRLLHAMWREAIFLVQSGIASAGDVDKVARLTFGLRMPAVGPLENMDLVGLDLIETIHEYLLANLSAAQKPLPLLSQMVREGRYGMKTSSGFYDWRARNPQELIERRNQQIIRQLEFLQNKNAL